MVGTVWRDASGNKFIVTFVDQNMNGTWVHYKGMHLLAEKEFSCLVDAFRERFTQVENTQ
jgi:hypothetical protein